MHVRNQHRARKDEASNGRGVQGAGPLAQRGGGFKNEPRPHPLGRPLELHSAGDSQGLAFGPWA